MTDNEYVTLDILLPLSVIEHLAAMAAQCGYPDDVESFAVYLLREAAASHQRSQTRRAKQARREAHRI